ncbi:MAG: hypothetical protein R2735_12725 [Microthrixaceae bacterium]
MDAETQDAESHNVRAHDVEDHNAAAQSLGSSTAVTSRRPAKVPFWARLLLWLVGIVSFSILLFVTSSVPGGTIISAVILGAIILRVGYFVLQQLATPPPPPPDPGTLRKVKLTYRCSICGTEVRMTAATNEDPEPPRHCMEDMDLVAPIFE